MLKKEKQISVETILQMISDVQRNVDSVQETLEGLSERVAVIEQRTEVSSSHHEDLGTEDDRYNDAKDLAIRTQKASVSYLQRKLGVGYSHAVCLIQTLEDEGVIGPQNGSKPRKVFIDPESSGGDRLAKDLDTRSDDDLYEDARGVVVREQKASTALLQRKIGIGYSRAAGLIDMLEENGVIGPQSGSKPREIFEKPESDE